MKYQSLVYLAGLLFLATHAQADTTIPAVHSLSIEKGSIIFIVTSHGCSKDADFKLRLEDGPRITLLRTRADFCKRIPMAFQVKRSLNDVGLSLQTPFSVGNPFTPLLTKGKSHSRKIPVKNKPVSK